MKALWSILCSILFSIFVLSSAVYGQTLDEEIGFIYVKAEYLLETGRNEEAVTNYNLIIAKDPKYKEALIHRGMAKFALGAYKGAKNDAMQSIDIKGIMPESAALLGRSFAAMNEKEAAINCLSSAISLDNQNSQFLVWRAAMYEAFNLKLKACADYEAAMKLGNMEAEIKAINFCGITNNRVDNTKVNGQEKHNNDPSSENTEVTSSKTEGTVNSGVVQNSSTLDSTTVNVNPIPSPSQTIGDSIIINDSAPAVIENIPKDDSSINSFVIDDDLTISISGQELGVRIIKEIPSILILADENGKVCINICVNKDGVVTKAEFNSSMSTIAQKSLVSLALRKAKEFEFMPGQYELQCGIMIFDIKGS